MTEDTFTETLEPAANCNLEQLANRVYARLSGRIRGFRVLRQDRGIVLRGLAGSYHAKQLAQHFIMTETQLPIVANEIEVCYPAHPAS